MIDIENYLRTNRWNRYLELRGEKLSLRRVKIENGQIHTEEYTREGVGIRAIDKREVFLSSAMIDLEKKVKKAISAASEGNERLNLKECNPLDTKEHCVLSFNPFTETVDLLKSFYEDLKKGHHFSVSIYYKEIEGEKCICTSEGTHAEKEIAFWAMSVEVSEQINRKYIRATEETGSKTHCMEPWGLKEHMLRKVDSQIKGIPPKSGTFPCVLGPIAAGTIVHEAVGHMCEADFADQGLRWMRGQQIAPDSVTIVDDGQYPGGFGTEQVDDEGVPTRAVTIIKKGVLNTFLTDRLYAERLELPLTGSARGESFKVKPLVRMRTIAVKEGTADIDELMEDIHFGYLCCSPQGAAVKNFRFRMGFQECYEIKNGEIGNPVVPHFIEGDTFSFLENIEALGKKSDAAHFECEKEQKVQVSQVSPGILLGKEGIYFH
ncbi:MAG: TldD/PmbA family protein [Theionarchaea archaeon]|nr:TldD/PmbA family protein [Theionarchaea archaeon]